MPTPTAWLIRAGERSRHARRFVDHEVVALGWPDVEALTDLRGMSEGDIRERLRKHPTISSPNQDTAELLAFRDSVRVGDVVVTPDAQTGEVLLGEIIGDYDYRDPSPAVDFKHIRAVRWHGRLDRDLLPADLSAETKWRRTIRRLGHQEQWIRLADRVSAGEGRDPHSRGRPDAPGANRSRHSPLRVPTRLCPSCETEKPKSQFHPGDDWCADCRADLG